MSRRGFLLGSALGGLAVATSACRPRAGASFASFPVVEARGGPRDIGRAVGAASRDRIRQTLERRRAWFERLRAFALGDRAARLDAFVAAIERHHPGVLAELRGLAEGAGLPLDDVLVLNLQPELGALEECAAARPATHCGDCSTLHVADGRRLLLAHNEDDDDACRDQMIVIRAYPDGQPAFVSLAYPGVIPGNVPAMTGAGLVRTTNFIAASEVRAGVPRYVLGRAVLAARSLEEAIGIARNPDGAYSFHLNLGSTRERRLVSVEVAPGGLTAVRETRGEVYVHTNHFVLDATRDVPQRAAYTGGSSDSRYRVLAEAVAGWPPPAEVGTGDLVRLLSSHESKTEPYSPCRHPRGEVRGRTVAMALFEVVAGTFTLYEGNPCEGRSRALAPPPPAA